MISGSPCDTDRDSIRGFAPVDKVVLTLIEERNSLRAEMERLRQLRGAIGADPLPGTTLTQRQLANLRAYHQMRTMLSNPTTTYQGCAGCRGSPPSCVIADLIAAWDVIAAIAQVKTLPRPTLPKPSEGIKTGRQA